MKRLILILALLLPLPAVAQPVNGCVNGVLADAPAYVWPILNRAPGQPAGDWEQVLRASGLTGGPGPHQQAGAAFYGITQQIGAGGPRGQLFLPTASPDELGYYTHTILLLANAPGGDCSTNAGACVWAWIDRGGPPYAPRQCATTPTPTPVPVPTPTPQPVPVPVDQTPILTALNNLSKQIDLFSANNTAEHKALGEKIDKPGWFERIAKHPAVIAAESLIAGYVLKMKLD